MRFATMVHRETLEFAGLWGKGDFNRLVGKVLAYAITMGTNGELSVITHLPKPASLGQIVVNAAQIKQCFLPFQAIGSS